MKGFITEVYTHKIKYSLITFALVTMAVFVVLPLMPQVHSTVSKLSLQVGMSYAEDGGGGDGGGGSDGGDGSDGSGGGCCGADNPGAGANAGNGDPDAGGGSPDGDGGGDGDGSGGTVTPPPVTPTPTDLCPNIAGDQETIPAGMIKDAAGNCVPPPTPSGTISVTPGACVTATERAVRVAWSTQHAQNIVAQASGGIYGSGQNLIAPTPTPSGDVTLTLAAGGYAFSVSGHNGSVWTMLQNTSLIVETASCDPNIAWTPYCTGADDPNGNNWQWWEKTTNTTPIQYRFLRNGDGSCVPPLVVDECPNIVGNQATIPAGMIKDAAGNCVTPSPEIPSCDNFTATPATLSAPGEVSLVWNTSNADTVSIDNGIGNVPVDGVATRTVSTDTTFTLTATKGSESRTCQVFVDITTVNPPTLSCDAFSITPGSVSRGSRATMTWNTSNADSVSISDIGSVAVDGSQDITVNEDKTYTLTATKGSETKTCTASVSVTGGGGGGGGGGSSAPRCTSFVASDTTITSGQAITLKWKTVRGSKVVIDHDVTSTTDTKKVKEGSVTVRPTKDTKYTLTVSKGSRKDTCIVNVKVGGLTTHVLRDQQPLTSVSFSNLPYTGFEAGPMLTSIFYVLLTLWSLALAYVLVIKRGTVFGFSLARGASATTTHPGILMPQSALHDVHTEAKAVTHEVLPRIAEVVERSAPANLPTASFDQIHRATAPVVEPAAEEALEAYAHGHNVLLSSDALRAIVDHAHTAAASQALLEDLVRRAKATYAREDGWVILNRERVLALFPQSSTHAPEAAVVQQEAIEVRGAHTLAEAILTQNTIAAVAFLQGDVMEVIADAAEALDAVVRTRAGSATAPDMLMRAADGVSDEKVKAAISALVTAIDGTYADEVSAAKLAVIKALKAVA